MTILGHILDYLRQLYKTILVSPMLVLERAVVLGGVDLWDPGLKDGKGSGSRDSALPTG